jgi:hypothetical protein
MNMAKDNESYQHTPLDGTQGRIRLLELLPQDTSSSLVQCRIWHSTINTTYRCLSYVWGAAGNEETIILNGKTFRCRKNLADFLKAASLQYGLTSKALWIDAICIDQQNDIERSQQVAYMGDVYSRANEVLVWLGCDDKIASFFRFTTRLAEETHSKSEAIALWWREQKHVQASWTRAWITQELFLANTIRILASNIGIGRRELKRINSIFPWMSKTITASSKGSDAARILGTYIRVMAGGQEAHSTKDRMKLKRRLIDLLHFLPFRESHLPRDHIYSLRAIAQDGFRIPVDYGSSDNQFAEDFCKVLATSKSMCFCSLACIAHVLPCDAIQQFPVVTFTMAAYSPSRKRPKCKQSKDRKTETFCGGCDLSVSVDVDQSLLLCLQQECSLFPGLHLSLVQRGYSKSDEPILKIATATADGYAVPVEVFHIKRLSTATQVSISVRLHPLIRFTRYLEKKNGEICRKALDKSARFEMDYKVSRRR